MSKVFGGKLMPTKGRSFTTEDGCTHTTTDTFDDKDGNGVYNWGETYTETTTVVCP